MAEGRRILQVLRWFRHTAWCTLRGVRADQAAGAGPRRNGLQVQQLRCCTALNLRRFFQSSGAPIVFQAASDTPIFRGVGDDGADLRCAECGSLLLANVSPGAVFDIALGCAGCGTVAVMPAGRRAGGWAACFMLSVRTANPPNIPVGHGPVLESAGTQNGAVPPKGRGPARPRPDLDGYLAAI